MDNLFKIRGNEGGFRKSNTYSPICISIYKALKDIYITVTGGGITPIHSVTVKDYMD